jgi:hypothetical protein
MRTKLMVYGGLIVVIVLLAVGLYAGYQFYYTSFAATPEKALLEYFGAFSRGDYNRMYDMTRGVPGSPQTAGEFSTQVRWLVKDTPPRIASTEWEDLGSKGSARYFKALLKLLTPDGSYRMVSLLVEVVQDGSVWKVSYPFAPAF